MTPEFVLGFSRQALTTAMVVAAPILFVGLVVGLVIAVFQAVTQIHEVTLTFIPKIIAMALAAYMTAGWMMDQVIEFARRAFALMSTMGA